MTDSPTTPAALRPLLAKIREIMAVESALAQLREDRDQLIWDLSQAGHKPPAIRRFLVDAFGETAAMSVTNIRHVLAVQTAKNAGARRAG